MLTRKDYERMARYISDHSGPGSNARAGLMLYSVFIAEESDKQRGNSKLFDKWRFLDRIKDFDNERKTQKP